MYDSQGVAQKVFYNFTKTAANTWDVSVDHADGDAPCSPATQIEFDTARRAHRPDRDRDFELPGVHPARRAYPSWPGPVDDRRSPA